jgi:hypothetical protein
MIRQTPLYLPELSADGTVINGASDLDHQSAQQIGVRPHIQGYDPGCSLRQALIEILYLHFRQRRGDSDLRGNNILPAVDELEIILEDFGEIPDAMVPQKG